MKEYEGNMSLEDYKSWQERIIRKIIPLLSDKGSICWQVGFYKPQKGKTGKAKEVYPLDFLFFDIPFTAVDVFTFNFLEKWNHGYASNRH